MGLLGDAFGAVTNTIDAGTGGWWSDSSTKASAKRNFNYNNWLQSNNQEFQKYMAENAHQMEVQDLINAGLNPALSATGSSASSIAGKSATQGTSPGSAVGNLGNIVDSINAIRKTNAEITKMQAETDAIKRGGFHQWWLGGKNPSITSAINNRADEAIQEKNKNYTKEEKEIADKFDNFWGN